jgi:hypothetical protein
MSHSWLSTSAGFTLSSSLVLDPASVIDPSGPLWLEFIDLALGDFNKVRLFNQKLH